MPNQYSLGKYLAVLLVVVLGCLYAAPNLYQPDPAVQISGQSGAMEINDVVLETARSTLAAEGIEFFGGESDGKSAQLRLKDPEQQLRARDLLQAKLGGDYVIALNLAETTPGWLSSFGAKPMKLGLDLSGGVHFLLEVDLEQPIHRDLESKEEQIKQQLREERLRYRKIGIVDKSLEIVFRDEAVRTEAIALIRENFRDLSPLSSQRGDDFIATLSLSETAIDEMESNAMAQNLTSLRNRVNELGVAEPIVQRQGRNRIVVQLPGVQDPALAKRVIGKTANLEFRLESSDGIGEEFDFKNPERGITSAVLQRRVVITGDHVTGAQSGFDENSRPQVNISLSNDGGTTMAHATRDNIGRRLGVLFIEYKTRLVSETNDAGETEIVPERFVEKQIISLATIQAQLGHSFRITGLDSPQEASELALLLRAGALAAPMYIVEERTIGPSLGAENIAAGVASVIVGLALVLGFMMVIYKVFGLFANVALVVNIVLVVACMSILGATLTLPGIAGLVLTVGMAVDANVLIFSRIREELRLGQTIQGAISAGYDRAYVSIVDANVTTLIVALILYAIGTGPVQGFAVTLSIGILTSMFTAIIGTRALTNLVYGGRRVNKLYI